jgi:Dinucleotide-utilizing enzymes involved in molybdopterin and thiamine biosynthesis family 2
MSINDEELEIFSRQIILKEFNEKKFNELQKKNITVVGLGGIGCPLSLYLISCGIKNLNLFDRDIIKKNNLNRQTLYSIDDIGKKKSKVAKKKLLKVNPNANINSYNTNLSIQNLNLLN